MSKSQWIGQAKYIAAIGLMLASAVIAQLLRPGRMMADELPPMHLEETVPVAFGAWVMEPAQTAQVVNPETKQLLESLYSETLSRVYVDSQGRRVMLSIAYGRNQADDKAVHYPEVCYPAQGFQISDLEKSDIALGTLSVPLVQMIAVQGDRQERVMYWATVGQVAVRGPWQHKLAQLKYSFRGIMPDGLIFRVSSVNRVTKTSDQADRDFINAIYLAVPVGKRERLFGTHP